MSLNASEIHAGGEVGPACFPSAEEIRMVRSIGLLALVEALHHGSYVASFHGFRIQAKRGGPASDYSAFDEVSLSLSLAEALVARILVRANYAQALEPNP